MKNNPFIVFFLCFYASVFSQSATISGKISNKNQQSLELVSIVAKQDSIILKGVTTDKNGRFTLQNLPISKFQLEVSYLGYETQLRNVEFTSETPNKIINFTLIENKNILDEVSVTAKKTTIVQKVDKKVVNVGNDLISVGTNALELLQNIPFVLVDNQEQSISMRGSKNVRVFIDGKPSNLTTSQILKQIPSNNVKQIELITNPSAKYTAEGTGGIINFILKKNKQYGFNGTVATGIEYGENLRPSFSTNMNYREGKVNFFGSYNIDSGKTNTYTGLYRTDTNLNQDIDFVFDDLYQSFKIGADIYLNDKNTLSFYTSQAFDNADYLIDTKVNKNNILSVNQNLDSKIKTKEQTYNVDYKLTFNNEHSIEFDISHLRTKTPENNIYSDAIDNTSKEYNFFNTITNNTNSWLFNVDYLKPLSQTSKLEAGIDIRLFSTFNQILSDQTISSLPVGNNKLNYDRNIYAYYVTYSKEFGKFSAKGGLRSEYFTVDGLFNNSRNGNTTSTTYKDDIFNVYPSVFLTYIPTDNDEWYASYSKRVDRPSIEQINPIPDFSTPLTISTGNQDLLPQYTNAFEINYTRFFEAGYTSLGGVYRSTSNKIDRAIFTNPTNSDIQILSFVNNSDGTDQFGFESYTEVNLKKWWKTTIAANYYRQKRTGLVGDNVITVNNNRFYTFLNNSFTISKRLSLQLNSFYSAKSKAPIFTLKPYGKVDFGAKLNVLRGNGNINFRINDIFKTMKHRFSSEAPLPQTGFMNSELRVFYLGFSYNFGKGKNKARKRKQRDKNETQSSGGVL